MLLIFHNIVMHPKRSSVLGPSSHQLDRYPDTVELPHGNTDLACVASYNEEVLDITSEGTISQESEKSKDVNLVSSEGE